MNKSFIFDLDGVLINNEPVWEESKKEIYIELFGEDIFSKMGSTVGLDMHTIYRKAVSLGATVPEQSLLDAFYKHAKPIYGTVPITEGIEELGKILVSNNYIIGVVSASPLEWINLVIDRLSFTNHIKKVLSLEERDDLPHKPAPDGYLEAIRELNSKPSHTIILEDSNAGIQSAKSAGAYVIGLKQNLVPGYVQRNADVYIDSVKEAINIVLNFSPKD